MDIALRVGDTSVAQLAAGVADKLRDAVVKYGDLILKAAPLFFASRWMDKYAPN